MTAPDPVFLKAIAALQALSAAGAWVESKENP